MTPRKIIVPSCACGDSNCNIIYGTCHCGCGQPTSIAKETLSSRKQFKGKPVRFCHSHGQSPQRFAMGPHLCVCNSLKCKIPYGYCHCGCGGKTTVDKANDVNRGHIKGMARPFKIGHGNRIMPSLVDAAPFKIDGVYCRLIPLTRGQYAIVDATDYEWLMQWKWMAQFSKSKGSFYASRAIEYGGGKRGTVLMHRQIAGLEEKDKTQVDHIYGKATTENRRKNIRLANSSQNGANKERSKRNTSGLKGACFAKKVGRWVGQIQAYKKTYFLGYFDTKEEAHTAYCKAAEKLFGEFANDGN